MSTINKETLKNNFRNQLLIIIKECNLSGDCLINYIYSCYLDDCNKFGTFEKREFSLMFDKYNLHYRSCESIINFFVEYRLCYLSNKAKEEYLS